ncbi:hypothetical protein OROHE_008975 [Orobanche hederae]
MRGPKATSIAQKKLDPASRCHMVYRGAVHSRFEHPLGLHWLADERIYKVNANQGVELGIERSDKRTVKLAGLLYYMDHGPFSHLFEREFLPKEMISISEHASSKFKIEAFLKTLLQMVEMG